MKKRIETLFFAGITVLLLSLTFSCKKSNPAVEALPPVTFTGKNTFGFNLDGQIWLPNVRSNYSTVDCAAQLSVLNASRTDSLPIGISFSAGRKTNNENSYLSFVTKRIAFPPGAWFSKPGNIFDSLEIEYTAPALHIFYTRPNRPGSFTVTKLDMANRIMAGNFDFTLFNGQDSIVISDGRFDMKF